MREEGAGLEAQACWGCGSESHPRESPTHTAHGVPPSLAVHAQALYQTTIHVANETLGNPKVATLQADLAVSGVVGAAGPWGAGFLARGVNAPTCWAPAAADAAVSAPATAAAAAAATAAAPAAAAAAAAAAAPARWLQAWPPPAVCCRAAGRGHRRLPLPLALLLVALCRPELPRLQQ